MKENEFTSSLIAGGSSCQGFELSAVNCKCNDLHRSTELPSATVITHSSQWVNHILQREPLDDSRIAFTWVPSSKRHRERPEDTCMWDRMVEKE